jgi:uncharacterized protein YbjQ (UPF0145 family)
MLVTTSENIPGKSYQALGLVRGNIVYSKNIGRDIMANMKTIVGGEIKSYTDMVNEARDVAEQRMEEAAAQKGADAVVAMRFAESTITQGTTELLAYGTAVKFV